MNENQLILGLRVGLGGGTAFGGVLALLSGSAIYPILIGTLVALIGVLAYVWEELKT